MQCLIMPFLVAVLSFAVISEVVSDNRSFGEPAKPLSAEQLEEYNEAKAASRENFYQKGL